MHENQQRCIISFSVIAFDANNCRCRVVSYQYRHHAWCTYVQVTAVHSAYVNNAHVESSYMLTLFAPLKLNFGYYYSPPQFPSCHSSRPLDHPHIEYIFFIFTAGGPYPSHKGNQKLQIYPRHTLHLEKWTSDLEYELLSSIQNLLLLILIFFKKKSFLTHISTEGETVSVTESVCMIWSLLNPSIWIKIKLQFRSLQLITVFNEIEFLLYWGWGYHGGTRPTFFKMSGILYKNECSRFKGSC